MIFCSNPFILQHVLILGVVLACLSFCLGYLVKQLFKRSTHGNESVRLLRVLVDQHREMKEVISELTAALCEVHIEECHHPQSEQFQNLTAERRANGAA